MFRMSTSRLSSLVYSIHNTNERGVAIIATPLFSSDDAEGYVGNKIESQKEDFVYPEESVKNDVEFLAWDRI